MTNNHLLNNRFFTPWSSLVGWDYPKPLPLSPIQSRDLGNGAGVMGLHRWIGLQFSSDWTLLVLVFFLVWFCCSLWDILVLVAPCKILDPLMRGRRIRTPHPLRIHISVSFMRAPHGSCIPKWRGSRRHKLVDLGGECQFIRWLAFICASMHHAFHFTTFSWYYYSDKNVWCNQKLEFLHSSSATDLSQRAAVLHFPDNQHGA